MDYLEIYNHFYAKAFNVSRRIIISKFKFAKAKNRPFQKFGNDIGRDLQQYRIEKFEKKLKDKAAQSFAIFSIRHEYVVGEREEVIKQILEEEVLDAFEDSKSYTYTHFIADLAVEDCLREVGRHYHNHYSYYEIIYDLDRYDYFYLKDFKGNNFENSDEYQEMLDIKYPYRIEEPKESEKLIIKSDEVLKKTNKSTNSKKEEQILTLVNDFTDGERMLIMSVLVNLMKRGEFEEHLTRLLKLIKIIGSYKDLSVFLDKAQSSTIYSQANKGVDYYSGKGKLKIVDSTLLKLQTLDLEFISERLKAMRIKILNKQRK